MRKYLFLFIEERVEELVIKIMRKRSIKQLSSELLSLQGKILESLSDDGKGYFIDYEHLENVRTGIVQKRLYFKGIIDGIKIASVFNKILKP
jgi:gluconate kinase